MEKEPVKKEPMIILTGPTAVGKTALSVELAKRIGGAVISADSMQVYKYMDIGSAKITREEMKGVPHYLIDELMPWDEFHVVRFVEMAKQHLEKIRAEKKLPVIVGGTGFYIQALLYNIDFTEQKCDEEYRGRLAALAGERVHWVPKAVTYDEQPRGSRVRGSDTSEQSQTHYKGAGILVSDREKDIGAQ